MIDLQFGQEQIESEKDLCRISNRERFNKRSNETVLTSVLSIESVIWYLKPNPETYVGVISVLSPDSSKKFRTSRAFGSV